MEPVAALIWIGFFIAAFLVQVSKRGNLFIVLALVAYGLRGFIFSLMDWGLLDYYAVSEVFEVLQYLPLAGSVLLIIGIILLARGAAQTPAGKKTMQDAKGVSLASLFTPRNDTNTFSRAELLRDEACARVVEQAKADGLEVIEQRSQAHSPTVWFRVDYQLPAPNDELSLTASVAVDIERFDFHRFEHTFNVTVQVGARKRTVKGLLALDDAAVRAIHEYIRTPGKKLRLRNRVREWPFQLWRPLNKVKRIRPDWVAAGLSILGFALLVLIPIIGLLALVGILFGLYLRAQKRRTYVLTSGKPLTDPRSLMWMDSWQASVVGLGGVADTVREGIMTRLGGHGPEGARVNIERIGYWGTDRWVSRQQIVVSHRRAIGFIHVAPYGEALYVAWECHLNSAAWVEEKLAAGVDRESGLDVVANRVVAGWHQLNEYDLSDSNFLAEWMHEAVTREVKLRMAEHKIDQEIDFTVQRESRKDALASSGQRPATDKPKAGRFKRLA